MSEVLAQLEKKGVSGEKCVYGSVTVSGTNATKVITGFKPKFVCVFGSHSASQMATNVYSKEGRDGYTLQAGINSGSTGGNISALPNTRTGAGNINSIDDDGFTISVYNTASYNAYTDNGIVYYVAVE